MNIGPRSHRLDQIRLDQIPQRCRLPMSLSRMRDGVFDQSGVSRTLNAPENSGDRKQFPGTALAGEPRYRNIVDNANIGIGDVSVDGTIIYANPAALKMFEYDSLDELRKINVTELWHRPEQRDEFISKLRQDGYVNNYEIEYLTRTGTIITLLASAIIDGDMISQVVIDISERKRAKGNMLISDEILVNMLEGVCLVRAEDGIIVMSNPAFDRLFGYAPSELIGKQESIVAVHAEDEGDIANTISSELNKTGKWQGELVMIRRDGSRFWSQANYSSLDHPEFGRVWVSVHTDITRRKKSIVDNARLLHDSRERLKKLDCLFATSNSVRTHTSLGEMFQAVVAAIPPGWQYPEITRSKLRFDEDEWVSESFEETEWKLSSDIVLAGKCRGTVEVYYLEERPTLDEGPFMQEERNLIDSIANTLSDALARRNAEEEKQKSRTMFDSLFSLAPVGIAIYDADMRYVSVNETLAKINGSSIDEHLQKRPIEMLPEKLGSAVQVQMQEILRTGQPIINREFSGETVGLPGVIRTFLASIFPIRGISQDITGLASIVVEITEAKKTEEKLRQSQKMEALGTLSGGIAHDFNNFLYPIIVNGKLLLENHKTDSEEYPLLDDIVKSALNAKDLVSQILIFGRRSDNVDRVHDFVLVADEAMKLLRPALPQTISIERQFHTCAIPVLCNSSQLYQVMVNLFNNAQQAISHKGEIKVTLDVVEIEKLECVNDTLLNGTFARLMVADNGVGMDDETRAKMFDPFFTMKKLGQGTGLGLATVFGIVQSHGGGITVSSKLGSGTMVAVYLPLAEDASDEPRETAAGRQDDIHYENILFVDDDEPVRRSAQVCLERSGYGVTTASDGQEALEVFLADPKYFSLVITDQAMANMTGEDLSVELIKIRPEIPIIICTGHSVHIRPDNISELGIRAFLQKPTTPTKLRQVVREVLDESVSGQSTD